MNRLASAKLVLWIMTMLLLFTSATAAVQHTIPFTGLNITVEDSIYNESDIIGIIINNEFNTSIHIDILEDDNRYRLGSCAYPCTVQYNNVKATSILDIVSTETDTSLLRAPLLAREGPPVLPRTEYPSENITENITEVEHSLHASLVNESIVIHYIGNYTTPILHLTSVYDSLYVPAVEETSVPRTYLDMRTSVINITLLEGITVVDSISLALPYETNKTILNITSQESIYLGDTSAEVIVHVDTIISEIFDQRTILENIFHFITFNAFEKVTTVDDIRSISLISEEGEDIAINVSLDNTTAYFSLPVTLAPGFYTLEVTSIVEGSLVNNLVTIAINAREIAENKVVILDKLYNESQLFILTDANNNNFTAPEIIRNDSLVEILPVNGTIKKLVVNATNLSVLAENNLRFDHNVTNITAPLEGEWEHVWSIDPESTNVSTITITATAVGNAVYKCAAWNFSTSTCNGEWIFVKGVVPGEEYTVTIDKKDPAFGEVSSYLKMEWGILSGLSDGWQTINLTNSYQRPVIVATPIYTTAGEETVTRIANITQTTFDVRLQDATSDTSTTRDISYIVIEEGAWQLPDGTNIEAFTFHSTSTDHDADWSPELQSYQQSYTSPIVLGQVMSYNDTDWSVFWASDGTQAGSPTAANIYASKQVAEDPSTTRNNEEIGVIVIEAAHGTLAGVEYEADLSGDSIQGITNSPPYTVTFDTGFGNAPPIRVLSSSGMDGGNGGWPVAYGSSTTANFGAAIDEYNDGERSHTTTTIAYFVFNESGSYNANTAPQFISPAFNETDVEPTTDVLFSVNVTDGEDNLSVEYVNATIRYPNGTLVNISLSQVAIGDTTESGDLESGVQDVIASALPIIGETGIVPNVDSWQTVNLANEFVDPVVFVFGQNGSDISFDVEQSLAIVRNVQTDSFEVSLVYPDGTFTFTEDVGYLVMEKGRWEIEGTVVEVGNWSYSGTSFVTRSYSQAFGSTPTTYIQLQNQTTPAWYVGRYEEASNGASSIQIQYEDAFNAFSGTYDVGYIAFEQGETTSVFEGNEEFSVADDSGSGTFRTVNYAGSYTEPVVFGIVSDGGGDPTKLGIQASTTTSLDVRPTEENVSDPELNHATNDVLWMVFNGSVNLVNDSGASDEEATKTSVVYEDIVSDTFNFISSIQVVVDIDVYDNSGSQQNANNDPTLQIELYDGTDWVSIGSVSGTGNRSRTTFSSSIGEGWADDVANRDVRITPIQVDYFNDTTYDEINWSSVYVNVEAGNRTVTWRYQVTDTGEVGEYNITELRTSDGILQNITSYSTLGFNVTDRTPPTIVVLFNVTVADDQPLVATYLATDYSGIDTWAINDTTNFFINSTGTLFNNTNLSEGIYYINISVNDTYNNIVYDVIRVNVTTEPDTVPPLFDHVIDNVTANFGFDFVYDINASDDRGVIDAYTVNDTVNFAIDEFGFLTNATVLQLGTYYANISVNDTTNNINSSVLTIYVVDIVPPIFVDANNRTFEFGFAVYYDLNATDDWLIDSYSINDSRFSIDASGVIENTTALSRGSYIFNVTVNDTSGNENTTTMNFSIVDTIPPSTVTALENITNSYDWIVWSWTEPGESDYAYASVYLDDVFYTNTSDTSINVSGLSTGTAYTLTVQTVDNDGNVNDTNVTNTSSTLVNNLPDVNVVSPLNLSGSLEQYRLLNFSVTDVEDSSLCITVYANNSEPADTQHILYINCSYTAGEDIIFNWSAPVLGDVASAEVLWHFDNNSLYGESDGIVEDFATGTVEHDITCTNCPTWTESGYFGGAYDYDGINDAFEMTEQFFNDAFSQRSYQLWFNADSTSGIRYLYEEGGATNGLGFRINNGVFEYATRTGTTQYTTTNTFTDTSGWHFLVVQYDAGTMEVYLDGVLINSTDTSGDYTTIAAHSDEAQLGGSTGGDAFGGATGNFEGRIDEFRITTTVFNATEIADMYSLNFNTTYYWTVQAQDTFDVNSEEYQFQVEPAEYELAVVNVTFDPEPSMPNINTTIFAVINSSSNLELTNVLVEFFDTNTSTALGNVTIATIAPGEEITVNVSSLFNFGNHSIRVTVDADGSYAESNETDNVVTELLFVSSWATFYGDFESNLILGDNLGNSVYDWIDTNNNATILMSSNDAVLNIAALEPLGRTTLGGVSTSDFTEADTALNLTDRYDAMLLRFASDSSTPRQTRTFTIGSQTFVNVPYINSTDNDNFHTGVLWDATGDTDQEYGSVDNENLVFVTEVNRGQSGAYGIYDYEITIPATIQNSDTASSEVGVYIELE